jgi:hypothetical protein
MNSMKLLPDVTITAQTLSTFLSDRKGKRKATDDGSDSQSKKVICGVDSDQEDGEVEDASGTDDLHAMQVSEA